MRKMRKIYGCVVLRLDCALFSVKITNASYSMVAHEMRPLTTNTKELRVVSRHPAKLTISLRYKSCLMGDN